MSCRRLRNNQNLRRRRSHSSQKRIWVDQSTAPANIADKKGLRPLRNPGEGKPWGDKPITFCDLALRRRAVSENLALYDWRDRICRRSADFHGPDLMGIPALCER